MSCLEVMTHFDAHVFPSRRSRAGRSFARHFHHNVFLRHFVGISETDLISVKKKREKRGKKSHQREWRDEKNHHLLPQEREKGVRVCVCVGGGWKKISPPPTSEREKERARELESSKAFPITCLVIRCTEGRALERSNTIFGMHPFCLCACAGDPHAR